MPSPELVFDTFVAYQRTEALKAALELDLFTAIADGHKSVAAIGKQCQASPRGIRILSDYLTVIGFLNKNGLDYSLTEDSAIFLSRHSPAYLGDAPRFIASAELTGAFKDLARTVRQGTTTLEGQGTVSHDNPVWVDFARGMMGLMMPAARALSEMVAGDQPRRVLDIAAGHGLFGILIAQSNPRAQIVAVDWRNVLAVAQENAQAMGVSERYSIRPGSAFEVDFGTGYDTALVTNFFHHFNPAVCGQLMRKIHAALKPGGRCVTLEFVPNEDRVSPPVPATFALMMLGSTPEGDAYTFSEYQSMFQSAGFDQNELRSLSGLPQSAIISTKPTG